MSSSDNLKTSRHEGCDAPGGRTGGADLIRVLKFGGTSVGTPESIRNVVRVVVQAASKQRVVTVVSALSQVTDDLEALVTSGAVDAVKRLLHLYRRHILTAQSVLPAALIRSYREVLGKEFAAIVPAVRRIRGGSDSTFDVEVVLAAGERFSAPLLAAALRASGVKSRSVDASQLICVHDAKERRVDERQTGERIRDWYETVSHDVVPVITGFIGSSRCGQTLTLGRGGSDFSASLLASSLQAEVLERWTDVDGLYSSDPNQDPNAKKYHVLQIDDALALNQTESFGMHSHTLEPLRRSRTPLHVRSLSQTGTGTFILPGNSAGPSLTATVYTNPL